MYILFGSEQYYASGGFNDFLGSFRYLRHAISNGKQYIHHGFVGCFGEDPESYLWPAYDYSQRIEWWHVLCTETMQIVAKSRAIPFGEE